jgi:thiol:disulfide interchange protein DsbD
MKIINFIITLFFVSQQLIAQTGDKKIEWLGEVSNKKIKIGETFEIKVFAKISEGWHLYSTTISPEAAQPTTFYIKETNIFKITSKIKQPTPIIKYDDILDANTEYFQDNAIFSFNVKVLDHAKIGLNDLTVIVDYMMCNDRFCLPPVEHEIKLKINVTQTENIAITDVNTNNSNSETTNILISNIDTATYLANSTSSLNEKKTASADVDDAKSKGLLSFIGFSMTMGLLALLTPCVFPMVPITVSFFTKREQKTSKQGIRDATIYSIGIIFTFVILGLLLAILFGASSINKFAANPWINLIIAAIFIAFALNLFGLFEIALPASLLTKLNKSSSENSGIISILLMGLTFSLTSFTCTVPFIGTIMVAAANGDFMWPIIGMIAYATMFSLPFFLLALFPMYLKSMPKSGGWLNSVKVTMGFLEIAAAMKFLSNVDLVWKWEILTFELFLSAWVAISVLIVIYLLGKIELSHDTKLEKIGVARLFFCMFFLSISIYLSTGLLGKPLGELDAFLPPREYPSKAFITNHDEPKEIWLHNLNDAFRLAKEKNKKVFLDFTGYTCTNCRWMESNIFTLPNVKHLFENYILVKLYTDGTGDIYKQNQEYQENRFGTIALPFYVILDNNDNLISTFPGLSRDANEFISFLEINK